MFCPWVTPFKILLLETTPTNGATLPVSQLEQGGALVPLHYGFVSLCQPNILDKSKMKMTNFCQNWQKRYTIIVEYIQ